MGGQKEKGRRNARITVNLQNEEDRQTADERSNKKMN